MAAEKAKLEKATFAGGCFWCTEAAYKERPGVVSVVSGYTGGAKKNPTYEEVSSGMTGHAEAVQITYDPAKTSYQKLLDIYWHNINPTTVNQQFADHGAQYRTAIFYHTEEQKHLAEETKQKWAGRSGRIDEKLIKEFSTPETAYYICGPPLMVEAIMNTLGAMKVPQEKIKMEEFTGYP